MNPCLHIVLFQPEIPPNTGNIGRTCVALGAKLWLVRPLGFRLDTKTRARAGLDYWDDLDLEIVDDWNALETALADRTWWLLTKHAARSHFEASFGRGDVLVFGSESNGLPESQRRSRADSCLRIPMTGPVRSLNLAVSVGIVAYEAYRQFSVL